MVKSYGSMTVCALHAHVFYDSVERSEGVARTACLPACLHGGAACLVRVRMYVCVLML